MALFTPCSSLESQARALARLLTEFDSSLGACSLCCIYDDQDTAEFSLNPIQISKADVHKTKTLFGNRDNAVKHGLTVDGKRFEVYQHHAELVTGRVSDGSEGFALLKRADKRTGKTVYILAIHALPLVGAEVAHALHKACDTVFHVDVPVNLFS